MRSLLYASFLLWYVVPLHGQTGPGGVGNSSNNGLWLRADALAASTGDSIVFWQDESGNNNHARQTDIGRKPVYAQTSSLNGMPAVRLDGIDDQMIVLDDDILDNSTAITYFAVIRPRNLDSQPRGILGKRITFTQEIEYAYTWFFWSGSRMNLDVHTNNDRFEFTGLTFQNNQDYLLSWDFDGSRTATSRSVMYLGDSLRKTHYEQSTQLPNSNRNLVLGALNVDYGSYLGADYAEVIHYNYALNDVERLLVNNYLAGKYGLALSTTDVYKQDDPANGDYDFDIAGIGRKSAGVEVLEARGSGMMTVGNPRDLNDDEYLLWGHDGGDLTFATPTTSLPLFDALAERTWRISESSLSGVPVSVGAVDLTFTLPDYDPGETEKLALLIDSDDDGSFADEEPVAGAAYMGDDAYRFTNVTGHRNGSRIAIGRLTDAAVSALPVELVNFQLEANGRNGVVLRWEASERSVEAYFVERSTDGADWKAVAQISPSDNAGAVQTYQSSDSDVPGGKVYYRLRINHSDGYVTYSDVRVLELPNDRPLKLYPNPARNFVFVEGPNVYPDQLRWYDGRGEEVTRQLKVTQGGGGRIRIETTGLPSGLYRMVADRSVHTVLIH